VTRLTWVQPEDLLAHELVQAAAEGVEAADVAETWLAAGGRAEAPVGGASDRPVTPQLRALARSLLDELGSRPRAADVLEREPDDLAAIEALTAPVADRPVRGDVLDRVHGGWLGRACGCLLGKPVEKIPRAGIREILVATGRWPLAGWFTAVGLPDEVARRWPWNRRSAPTSLAENIDGMPEDDDLNFPMVALDVLEHRGHGFTTDDVADAWLAGLPGGRVFTAERVAYRNLLDGLAPPQTALVRNPFREWIGAQIRADVYGWTNPGRPAQAAREAWRDARLSHRGNGLYGAMFVAAMCASAVVRKPGEIEAVLADGLSVVPPKSRYADAVRWGAELGRSELPLDAALDRLESEFGAHHWVHVLNNGALVAFALARSRGDFAEGICTVVTGGWDTDSNGATVGSVCGALSGAAALPEEWTKPLHNRVASSLPGFDGSAIDALAARTVGMIAA
jgi:ADP-ribosylglycohydrolase